MENLDFTSLMVSVLAAVVWLRYLRQLTEKGITLPTYEFSCPICNVVVEQTFSVYSDHTMWCEKCKVQMDKQFSAAPVHFKAKGFYKTGD